MLKIIEWLWGHELGKAPFVKSWRPDLDYFCRDWRQWGIAWPVLGDRKEGGTRVPIWNFIWLRNRCGFHEKTPDWPQAM